MRLRCGAVALGLSLCCVLTLPTVSSGAITERSEKKVGKSKFRRRLDSIGQGMVKGTRIGLHLTAGLFVAANLKAAAVKVGLPADAIVLKAIYSGGAFLANESLKAATNRLFSRIERDPPEKASAGAKLRGTLFAMIFGAGGGGEAMDALVDQVMAKVIAYPETAKVNAKKPETTDRLTLPGAKTD